MTNTTTRQTTSTMEAIPGLVWSYALLLLVIMSVIICGLVWPWLKHITETGQGRVIPAVAVDLGGQKIDGAKSFHDYLFAPDNVSQAVDLKCGSKSLRTVKPTGDGGLIVHCDYDSSLVP